MVNTLYVLIGVSLSGKTTLAKKMIAEAKNRTYHVSRDKVREMMFGVIRDGNKYEEETVTKIIDNQVKGLIKVGDVILDNTNLHPNDYKRIITEYNNCNIKFIKLDLLSMVDYVKRNNLRRRETGVYIPMESIEKQIKLYNELGEFEDVVYVEPDNQFIKVDERIINGTNKPYNENDVIIVDMDGTLSLMNGRDPFIGQECGSDVINHSVLEVIKRFPRVFIFSGRNSDNGGKEATIKWLADHGVVYEKLVMREPRNTEPDNVIKKKMYQKHIIDAGENVFFVLDDRDQVVSLWRDDLKLNCFQVNYGNF